VCTNTGYDLLQADLLFMLFSALRAGLYVVFTCTCFHP